MRSKIMKMPSHHLPELKVANTKDIPGASLLSLKSLGHYFVGTSKNLVQPCD
jgi:hypothetical protein